MKKKETKHKEILVIVGPTSSGKTSLALKLCKENGGEIISADSRQVVKHMDIGTGKLPVRMNSDNVKDSNKDRIDIQKGDTKWVIDGVNVWGYDITDPSKYFSAYDYVQFATNKILELQKTQTNKPITIVGGTGFYIDALTGRKKLAGVKPDFELRRSLETTPTKNLINWLMSLNLDAAEKIDTKNRVRIIRALEKELKKEKKTSERVDFEKKLANLQKSTGFKIVGLTCPREILYKKVDTWLDTIWKNGLIEETKNLLDSKFANSPKLQGLVYKSAVAYLKGELAEEVAIQRAKFDLHAYIRRQQTYFKTNESIVWMDSTTETGRKEAKSMLI